MPKEVLQLFYETILPHKKILWFGAYCPLSMGYIIFGSCFKASVVRSIKNPEKFSFQLYMNKTGNKHSENYILCYRNDCGVYTVFWVTTSNRWGFLFSSAHVPQHVNYSTQCLYIGSCVTSLFLLSLSLVLVLKKWCLFIYLLLFLFFF